jgi:hypothetical protein
MQADLVSIAKELGDATIGKTKAKELQHKLEIVAHRLTDTTGFIADSFDEHVEKTVEKGKIEVNAYITSAVQRVGLDTLQSGNVPLLLKAN